MVGFVPSNYVRKESFVDKAKGTIKGFGNKSKSKSKLPETNQVWLFKLFYIEICYWLAFK